MSVDSQGLTIEQLLAKGRFTPARVQRGYRWNDAHQSQLLDDLEAALRRAGRSPYRVDDALLVSDGPVPSYGDPPPKKPVGRFSTYFLGHMLFDKTKVDDRFDIYDGQQRLTTLMLLLAALRDALPEGNERARVSLLLRHPGGEGRLISPTPGGMLARVLGKDGCRVKPRDNETAADESIRNGARAFLERLEQYTEEGKRALLQLLCDHVFVTATFFDDRRLAESAYVTVNTRGLRLDAAEVLKGHLVQVVSDVSHTQGQEVEVRWERLERDAGEAFPGFLRTLAFGLFRREQAASDYLPDWLDEFGEGPVGAARARRWVLEELPQRWKVYRDLVAEPKRGAELSGRDLYLRQLGFLPWDEWRSVALAAIERKEPDEVFRKLRDACYIMQLNAWDERHDQRVRVLSQALHELEAGRSAFVDGASREEAGALVMFRPQRARARSALKASMPPQRARPLVRLVETLLWLEASEDPAGFVGDATLEHVLPVAHREGPWPGFTADEREDLKGRLGNLCMLPGGLNADLDRAGYAEKRAAFLELSPKWRSAHDVAQSEDWTADVIRARTDRLAALVLKYLVV